MGKINDLLIAEAEKYISVLMAEKLPENIIFHNYDHALQVKSYAETIGQHSGLNAEEMNALRLAALFLDTGYVNSYEKCHEESIAIAAAFLAGHDIDLSVIDQVSGLIRAQKHPQEPKDKIGELLCDATLMFITTESGVEQFDLLCDEMSMQKTLNGKRSVCEKEYIDFLTGHTYFTDYGRTVLQPEKEAVLRRLSERRNRRKLLEKKKEVPPEKSIGYSRGVETMFRITARNQINLNSIADNKSNILISVNAIIISIIITMLVGNFRDLSQDILPILVLLLICLVTIVIAILSTRPNIVTSRFTDEDIRNKNVDLIFFGNFIKLNYEDYQKAVYDMMKDEDHLYSTLIKNQYSLGKILNKKFRLIRVAYNVFMIGIILTVIVFVINLLVFKGPA